jgi:outer membrane biogenesis lipoprotein LolB
VTREGDLMKNNMRNKALSVVAAVATLILVGCAGQPHQFYKVYGLGDLYAPKNVTLQEDQRYQNVRIIAVYDTNQIPALRS